MDAARLLALRLDVHVTPVRHTFLCEVKVISFWVVGAIGSEWTIGWPLEYRDRRIVFSNARHRLFNVIDIDAEVVQSRNISWLSANYCNPNIAIADTDRVICPDRFFFFSGTWFGSFHPEHSLVKLGF